MSEICSCLSENRNFLHLILSSLTTPLIVGLYMHTLIAYGCSSYLESESILLINVFIFHQVL